MKSNTVLNIIMTGRCKTTYGFLYVPSLGIEMYGRDGWTSFGIYQDMISLDNPDLLLIKAIRDFNDLTK